MPKMPDAEVVLTGTALFVEKRTEFGTTNPNGCDVSILGVSGLAIVRYSQLDLNNGQMPQLGRPLAVVASGSAWGQDRGAANVVYKFARKASEDDLNELHKTIKAASAAA